MRLRVGLAALSAAVCMCTSGDARGESSDGGYVIVQIGEVRVAPQRPGNAGPWDGEEAKDDSLLCSLAEAGGAIAGGIGAGSLGLPPAGGAMAGKAVAGWLCGSGTKQAQRDPKAPDLLVRLHAGTATTYYVPMARDTYAHDFRYEMLLPLAAVPDVGVKLTVLDQDGASADDGELMGSFRITLERLIEIADSTSPMVTLSDGAVQRFELIVRRAKLPTKRGGATVSVGKSLNPTQVQVLAGQMITVKASGKYNVVSFSSTPQVGPEGYPNGRHSGNNLDGLKAVPHASAIALVGSMALPVGTCGRFVAPQTGLLQVGVNDRDTGNNEGTLRFTWQIETPAAAEWATAGALLPCGTTTRLAGPASCEDVATHVVDLFINRASGDEQKELRNQRPKLVAAMTSECETKKMPPAMRSCVTAAATIDEATACKAKTAKGS